MSTLEMALYDWALKVVRWVSTLTAIGCPKWCGPHNTVAQCPCITKQPSAASVSLT